MIDSVLISIVLAFCIYELPPCVNSAALDKLPPALQVTAHGNRDNCYYGSMRINFRRLLSKTEGFLTDSG